MESYADSASSSFRNFEVGRKVLWRYLIFSESLTYLYNYDEKEGLLLTSSSLDLRVLDSYYVESCLVGKDK